jgi:4-hydroxybenzoate polyprenyltransferase
MKRITWWPQAWLGLVFSWAALVGWPAVTGEMELTALLLYAGSIFWVIGYDTIYALQDREDDALVGVKSSALALGRHARGGRGGLYLLALLLWGAAIWRCGRNGWRCWRCCRWRCTSLAGGDAEAGRRRRRARQVPLQPLRGLLMFLACLVVVAGPRRRLSARAMLKS